MSRNPATGRANQDYGHIRLHFTRLKPTKGFSARHAIDKHIKGKCSFYISSATSDFDPLDFLR
jgi:hypothetical protein